MLKDLNVLLDLGFSGVYNNEAELTGYRYYFEDLDGFIVIHLNGDLYFGLEYEYMHNIGNISEVKVSNIQEVLPSLRYYVFKKIKRKKDLGFVDRCKGIFLRDINI